MTPIERSLAIVLLVAGLLAGAWAFWHHYTGLIADNARLEDGLHTATAAFDAQLEETNAIKADKARTDALLAKRTLTAHEAQKEADRYAKLLNDARMDPAALQWMDAPVPRAVWCGLRQRPEGVVCEQNGKGAPAGDAPGGDAKPKAAGVDRFRLDYVLAAPRGGVVVVQLR